MKAREPAQPAQATIPDAVPQEEKLVELCLPTVYFRFYPPSHMLQGRRIMNVLPEVWYDPNF